MSPMLTTIAAYEGHIECLRLLLDAKAPINSYTIYRAASNGHTECLRLLLDTNKANIGLQTIYWANAYSETECAQLILNYIKTQNQNRLNQINQKGA